jgi:peptidoglycan/xylan/chitin deacetylase (PgdA/CDA1 family)
MSQLLSPPLRKSDYPLIVFERIGIFRIVRKFLPNYLTVLNYHRIDDPYRDGFDTFRPNVSATPSEFARQMDHVARFYNVISGDDLVSFIKNRRALPPRALLITFDDGYLDNYINAYPVLKSRNLPAIIFLATNHIGSSAPFYWDFVAYCFHHTKMNSVELPHLGLRTWHTEEVRERAVLEWIETLKKISEQEKQKAILRLPEILNVSIPSDAFARMMISWFHAREMSENGIEMGAHTTSHPILTRVPLDVAAFEISRSKRHIEDELNKPVTSFAYPNGQASDFNGDILNQVQQAGYDISFTLLSGPTRYETAVRHPFTIRRIFIGYDDNFSRFVAKLSGVSRLVPRW